MKVILYLVLVVSVQAKLPSYIKPCQRDDPSINKCFVENGNDALKTLVRGDADLKVPPVEPVLQHPGVKYEDEDFYMNVKETTVVGAATFKLMDAKVDLPKKSIWFQYKFETLDWKGKYVAKAKKANDEVEDKAHIIYTDNIYNANIDFDIKDGHMALTKMTVEFEKQPNIDFHFDNLDKHEAIKNLWESSKQNFINEGKKAIAQFLTVVFTNVFKAASYDEIFPPK